MVVMYCLGLFFSFTMLILQEWQHIHYQNQLNQTDKFQLLHFTTKEWDTKENKREFQIRRAQGSSNCYGIAESQDLYGVGFRR